jgi:hypothetical protein
MNGVRLIAAKAATTTFHPGTSGIAQVRLSLAAEYLVG